MAQMDAEFGVKGSSIIREWGGQVQLVLVASFVFPFCLWVRSRWLKRRLPGPCAWPVVGNALQLGQLPHITLTKLAKKYGNVYQIRLGCNDIVVLNGHRVIHEALEEHSTEFAGRPNFVSFQTVSGGKSVTLTNYSKQWKMHRKIAQSTIRAVSTANSQTKKAFEQLIVAEATELVEIFLKLSAQGQHFNPAHKLTVAAANVICALCFGKLYGHDDVEFRALLKRMHKFGETVGASSLVDVMPWLQSFPNPVYRTFKNFKVLNNDFINSVFEKPESGIGSTKGHAEGIVSDLIGAGLDTISTTLHWILLLLAKHPKIQTILYKHINEVVGPHRLPSVEDRSHLAYLDAFIYETMRFTSFITITIPHFTTSDVTIKGFHIPKDTIVFINQWSVNHDLLMWKHPHIFDPSCVLDKNGALNKDKTNSVMIFSSGRRRCIGDQIAQIEIFLFFAILLHQCSFERCTNQDLSLNYTYGLTLKPLDYKIAAKLRRE